MLGKTELENQLDDRVIKDIKAPKPLTIVVNTIVTELAGAFELWIKVGKKTKLLAAGLEKDIARKHQAVQVFVNDRKIWQYIRTPQDLIHFASRIASQ